MARVDLSPAEAVGMLLGVVLATFLLHHLLPMDPAAAVLGKHYTEEKAHELKERLVGHATNVINNLRCERIEICHCVCFSVSLLLRNI